MSEIDKNDLEWKIESNDFQWEMIVAENYSVTKRMRLEEGWLYKVSEWGDERGPLTIAMCFVPFKIDKI